MESRPHFVRTCNLVKQIADGCTDSPYSSITTSIYDTAWVSLVTKTDGSGRKYWLFPECFNYLLTAQRGDGGWQTSGSIEDGIVSTLAALLSLNRHRSLLASVESLSNGESSRHISELADLELRVEKATVYLRSAMQKWDVESSKNVAFEVTVTALISMLKEDGITIAYPKKDILLQVFKKKMEKFEPEMLYRHPTAFLHSAEALIGKIDYDRLRLQLCFGSLMGSPAATAAYLMNIPDWDLEAESYLKTVISNGSGRGGGDVPSVYPQQVFESSWAISILLQSGIGAAAELKGSLDRIAEYLEKLFHAQKGLVGFAPSVVADADDTAKAISILNTLGRHASPETLITHFKTETGYFKTYTTERDASFSANCNVLQALLSCPNIAQYDNEIMQLAIYLCDLWWLDTPNDKWNLSVEYSMMLLAPALIQISRLWDRGLLTGLPEGFIQNRLAIVVVQITNRLLLSQQTDGRWNPGDCPEVTAYAVIGLKSLAYCPWTVHMTHEIESAIKDGQAHLEDVQKHWSRPQYLWIEKVTYGYPLLSEAYCLAAMQPLTTQEEWSPRLNQQAMKFAKTVPKLLPLFHSINLFKHEQVWKLRISIIEGLMFLPQLGSPSVDLLPMQTDKKNKYLPFIPCTWVMINNLSRLILPSKLLLGMMLLTIYNFRVDEYMESTVASLSRFELGRVRDLISRIGLSEQVDRVKLALDPLTNGAHCSTASITSSLDLFETVICNYVKGIMELATTDPATASVNVAFRNEITTFLLSHVDQLEDNYMFASQLSQNRSTSKTPRLRRFPSPRLGFYKWAHTTGAISVSAPASFTFFTSLLGSIVTGSTNCFNTVRQQYIASDLCTHLAVMSRLYNDYGSLDRDLEEGNLNSVNFPEFHPQHHPKEYMPDGEAQVDVQETKCKEDLLSLAEYERACMDRAADALVAEMDDGSQQGALKARGIRLFVNVSTLYGEMYVQEDLSNPVVNGSS